MSSIWSCLGADHLISRGGVWFFVWSRIFFFQSVRAKIFFFLPARAKIFFFLPAIAKIFFYTAVSEFREYVQFVQSAALHISVYTFIIQNPFVLVSVPFSYAPKVPNVCLSSNHIYKHLLNIHVLLMKYKSKFNMSYTAGTQSNICIYSTFGLQFSLINIHFHFSKVPNVCLLISIQ